MTKGVEAFRNFPPSLKLRIETEHVLERKEIEKTNMCCIYEYLIYLYYYYYYFNKLEKVIAARRK